MIFSTPQPFEEALENREVRSLLPTTLRTRELAALAPELRERAMFSAGVTSAEFLQEADDAIASLLQSDISLADGRLQLQEFLAKAGLDDGDRFSTDLTKLSSIRRQNLILQTNSQMARGFGQFKQANLPEILDAWPAQELVRVTNAEIPREWVKRWRDNGGTLYEGRMIARKDSDIWTAISRFDLPYPPFDFNSGMGLRPVARAEAQRLGVIEAGEAAPTPQSQNLNAELEASPKVRSANLRTALETTLRGFAAFGPDGVLRRIAS